MQQRFELVLLDAFQPYRRVVGLALREGGARRECEHLAEDGGALDEFLLRHLEQVAFDLPWPYVLISEPSSRFSCQTLTRKTTWS